MTRNNESLKKVLVVFRVALCEHSYQKRDIISATHLMSLSRVLNGTNHRKGFELKLGDRVVEPYLGQLEGWDIACLLLLLSVYFFIFVLFCFVLFFF